MGDDSKLRLLRSVSFLADASDAELAELAPHVDEVGVDAGRVLTQLGDAGRQAFVVVEGWASVTVAGFQVGALGPGEFIGELAMLTGEPRTATVVATTPMRLLAVGPSAFQAFAGHRAVARPLATTIARRLRDADSQL